MNVASLSVPLVAPMTEYGDRINQLDINVTKIDQGRPLQHPAEVRPLQRAERVAGLRGRSLNYGTAAYLQPSVHSRRPRVPARRDREVLIWKDLCQ